MGNSNTCESEISENEHDKKKKSIKNRKGKKKLKSLKRKNKINENEYVDTDKRTYSEFF